MEGKAAHLKVNTHLRGADVLVDGQATGKTPLATSLTIAPGQHKIESSDRAMCPRSKT